MADLQMWANVLLLIGGLVHAIPPVYTFLADLVGGTAYIQIIVGIISVILALLLLFRK